MEKKVILISIDGARADAMHLCGNPYVKTLEQLCTYNYGSQAVLPSDTLPCHYSMTHGQTPDRHGIKTNIYAKPENPTPGIFETVRAAGGTTGMFYSRREPNSYALRREFFASFAKSRLARCVSCFDSL